MPFPDKFLLWQAVARNLAGCPADTPEDRRVEEWAKVRREERNGPPPARETGHSASASQNESQLVRFVTEPQSEDSGTALSHLASWLSWFWTMKN